MLRAILFAALCGASAVAQGVAPPPRPDAIPAPGVAPGMVRGAANTPDPDMGDDPAQFPGEGLALMGLDKFSAKSTAFSAPLGRETRFARLRVIPRECRDGPQGEMALLDIFDNTHADAPVFSGWMFADSPALSALDNPRYDVWLISCSTR